MKKSNKLHKTYGLHKRILSLVMCIMMLVSSVRVTVWSEDAVGDESAGSAAVVEETSQPEMTKKPEPPKETEISGETEEPKETTMSVETEMPKDAENAAEAEATKEAETAAVTERSAEFEDPSGTDGQTEAEEYGSKNLFLDFRYTDGDTYSRVSYASVLPFADIHEDALILEWGSNISKIVPSYLVGNNWVEITDENNSSLPADAYYQFEFTYVNVSAAALLEAGGQMIYKDLPAWFQPNGNGVLLYEGEVVAQIEAVDGMIVINFDEQWLEQHKDANFGGTFKVKGTADWHKLLGDKGDSKTPGLDITMNFEDGLEHKYGQIRIEKSEPVLEEGVDGKYYLKYELTVTSLEEVGLPDVTVRDVFENTSYIKEYVGADQIAKSLPNQDTETLEPWESSSEENFVSGQLSADGGSMLWEIGDLQPGEVRRLTYYAEIDESYIDFAISNPIRNQAEVYSGSYRKDISASNFMPKNDVTLQKEADSVEIGPDGSGTITYKLTVSTPEDNTFTLRPTLKDVLPEELSPYLSGDQGSRITVNITVETSDSELQTMPREVDYQNASFAVEKLALEPGATVTITYTVIVNNIFLASNEVIELTNVASINAGDRTLASAQNTETLEKSTWERKVVGGLLKEGMTVEMTPSGDVYEYRDGTDGGRDIMHQDSPPTEFEVPQGSLKYQVILNENGLWNFTGASMEDSFSNDFLKYVGYVQVQIFERNIDSTENSNNLSDVALIHELEKLEAVKTVWLKIDKEGKFAFRPEQLELKNGKYTYLLTYYAQPQGMEDVGSVEITNSFRVKGKVGVGNGDGTVELPGTGVSVGKIIQGGVKYDAEKTCWYYEPYPVYKTAAMESGAYPETTKANDGYSQQYKNGAIYWIIHLAGDIGVGKVTGSGNGTSLDDFYVYDEPDNQTFFNRDSVVAIYTGPKNFDFTAYNSYAGFVEVLPEGFSKLSGNPQNDKWFSQTAVGDPDYRWYADNNKLNGIIFTEKFIKSYGTIKESKSVYIVLRTALTDSLPAEKNTTKTYDNALKIFTGRVEAPINTARYTYSTRASLFKESKGAYTYDKNTGKFTNCSNRNTNPNTDWKIENTSNKDMFTSSGTYAAWLLNVNWNGSMSGTADIADYLPEGMELLYTDVNNFGNAVRGSEETRPKTEYIPELSASDEWIEMQQSCRVAAGSGRQAEYTAISYYNPTTREIRWRISNLTKSPKDVYNAYEINLRIFCTVSDPELFLSGKGKTYVNEAAILDSNTKDPIDLEWADVTIIRAIDKGFDESFQDDFAIERDNSKIIGISGVLNKIPFLIKINPFGEDMCDGDILPGLIDELAENIEVIEDSIQITTADGALYTNYIYTVQEVDGHQTLIIQGLPDNTPLTLSYNVRLNTLPLSPIKLSNTAYWEGNPPPDEPQVDIANAKYEPSGNIFRVDGIKVKILKVDAGSHSRKLDGAKFKLYEVDKNGSLKEPAIREGVTDSFGKIEFQYEESDLPRLAFNTVYCLVEEEAPTGYELSKNDEENRHYFVIVQPNSSPDFTQYGIKNLDIWYDSPEYSIVIENGKGIISVDKVFVDSEGKSYTPASGTYRFGLYDFDDTLLEILTIEYTETDPVYYLDGFEKDSPCFSNYEPERKYKVYELDAQDNPIQDGQTVKINGTDYWVKYSTDEVTVNSDIIITNIDQLIKTGGLTISKTVDGEFADKDKEFTFTVNAFFAGNEADKKPVVGKFSYIGGTNGEAGVTAPAEGTITLPDGQVKLKHGQSITIQGLPAGVSYSVVERKYGGYTADIAGDAGTISQNLSIAEYKNKYDIASEVIALPQITKTLTGRDLEANEYSFKLELVSAVDQGGNLIEDDVIGEYIGLPNSLTAENDSDGNVDFEEITFKKPGTYTISIQEEPGTQPDIEIIYDNSVYTVTYVVTDNGDGTLDVTESINKNGQSYTDVIEFENIYITPAEIELEGIKDFINSNSYHGNANFSFQLTAVDDAPMPADTDTETEDESGSKTKTVPAVNGKFTFGKIIFTRENLVENGELQKTRQFRYEIREVVPDNADDDIIYDATVYTAIVTLTDNNQGNLSAIVKYYANSGANDDISEAGESAAGGQESLTITNTYVLPVTWTPAVTKTLNGRDWVNGEKFTFTLTGEDDASQAILNEQLSGNCEIQVGKDETISFAPGIKFAKKDVDPQTGRKEYKFVLEEILPNGGNGISTNQSNAKYHLAVTVQLLDKQLSVTCDGKDVTNSTTTVTYVNTYSESGSFQASIQKTLQGRDWSDGDKFTFKITPDDQTTATVTPDGGKTTKKAIGTEIIVPDAWGNMGDDGAYTVTISRADADVNDGSITKDLGTGTINAEGDYIFIITEISSAKNDVSLDPKSVSLKIHAVSSISEGSSGIPAGRMNVVTTYAYQGESGGSGNAGTSAVVVPFTNQAYTAGSIDIRKILSGTEWNGKKFAIEISGTADNVSYRIGSDGDFTAFDGSLEVEFDSEAVKTLHFKFSAVKEYTFTVKEVRPDENPTNGIVYDETVYTVKFNVTVDENDEMAVTRSITKNTGTESAADRNADGAVNDSTGDDGIVFNNTYVLAPGTAAVPAITKYLAGRVITDGEFTFKIALPEGADSEGIALPDPAVVTNKGNTVEFGNITFSKPGIYMVEVKEVVPADAEDGIKYDDTVYTIVFDVKDGGNGQMIVNQTGITTQDGSSVDEIVFRNEAFGNLTITKELLGEDGKAQPGNGVFYAGIFADASFMALSDRVTPNVVKLSLEDASSVSVTVPVTLDPKGNAVRLYVTEVDETGKPVAGAEGFAYEVTVNDSEVVFEQENLQRTVTITNKVKHEGPSDTDPGNKPSDTDPGNKPSETDPGNEPGESEPGTDVPETSEPETEESEPQESETDEPETDVSSPETSAAETSTSDETETAEMTTQEPETEAPGTKEPETEASAEVPEMTTQEFVESETKVPGAGGLETEETPDSETKPSAGNSPMTGDKGHLKWYLALCAAAFVYLANEFRRSKHKTNN